MKWRSLSLAMLCSLTFISQRPAAQAERPVDSVNSPAEIRQVLDRYCVTCHNERTRTAGLTLDKVNVADLQADAATWEKVIRKVEVGMMPPAGMPRLESATQDRLLTALRTAMDRASVAHPNPGRPLVHRLNRTEYANSVRDLIDLEIDAASLLPSDASAFGFDTNADALGVSSGLLERYVSAASIISALAVGDPESPPSGQVFRVKNDTSQNVHLDGQPLGTIGGTRVRTTLPLDGEYVLQAKFVKTLLGDMRGLEQPHELEFSVDGARVFSCTFGGGDDFQLSLRNMTAAADAVEARCATRVAIKAGPRDISMAFVDSRIEGARRLQPGIGLAQRAVGDGDLAGHRRVQVGPRFVIAPRVPARLVR
jgi:mono/diheme cytochrome c family protein